MLYQLSKIVASAFCSVLFFCLSAAAQTHYVAHGRDHHAGIDRMYIIDAVSSVATEIFALRSGAGIESDITYNRLTGDTVFLVSDNITGTLVRSVATLSPAGVLAHEVPLNPPSAIAGSDFRGLRNLGGLIVAVRNQSNRADVVVIDPISGLVTPLRTLALPAGDEVVLASFEPAGTGLYVTTYNSSRPFASRHAAHGFGAGYNLRWSVPLGSGTGRLYQLTAFNGGMVGIHTPAIGLDLWRPFLSVGHRYFYINNQLLRFRLLFPDLAFGKGTFHDFKHNFMLTESQFSGSESDLCQIDYANGFQLNCYRVAGLTGIYVKQIIHL